MWSIYDAWSARYRWCSRIDTCCQNSTMWLLSLSCDSHHLLAFDQWCILCMLSNYYYVVGVRSDRWSAALSDSLQLVATWCKMATMIVIVYIVTTLFVDSFCHWLVRNWIVKHVHLLHAWYHYCRTITIAGVWYHWHRVGCTCTRWIAIRPTTVPCMYTSVKLTCTCVLLLCYHVFVTK